MVRQQTTRTYSRLTNQHIKNFKMKKDYEQSIYIPISTSKEVYDDSDLYVWSQ